MNLIRPSFNIESIMCGSSALELIERAGRSEERRVGKECRSRWSPEH